MQAPLQITFRGIDHSDAVESRVRAKVAELERFYDRITSCHVTIDERHKSHHQGNLFGVRLELRLPDAELIVGREHDADHSHEDVYVALRDAFEIAARQLKEYAQKQRGDVKRHAPS